jgi:hypothetical protein
MEHPITLSNINASFFSSHLLELVIMLTGTIIISFVAGRFFSKSSAKETELAKEETSVEAHTISENTAFYAQEESMTEKTVEAAFFEEKEKVWEERLSQSENQLQQSHTTANLLKEEKEVLAQQVAQLYDCLKQQLNDLSAVGQFRETIDQMEQNLATLQAENKQLVTSLEAYQNGEKAEKIAEITAAPITVVQESALSHENEGLMAQLKSVEAEKEKLAYAVVSLQEQIYAMQAGGGANAESGKESNGSLVKLMEEKVQILQKERNDLMGQISQLENQLKITHLTSLSKVDMEQEEENPIKRLTLYIRMLEGEKQGLNNKITDLTKKLTHTEASIDQIQAKEVELTYVKSRLAALEKDKRDVQNQSGEWEIMYKKLHEKTHYLLSTKETEMEQLKTTISYLEKDKSRLQGRITDMESELRSSVFNYKGRSPLAFNL